MQTIVDIENLTKCFGPFTAVDDVSFVLARGEVLGFLGPNGAGKSTTMRMITGFLTPDRGTVRLRGIDLAEQPVEVKRRIGYLPEGAPLYGDMTPRGFLDFVAEVRGFRGAELRRRVADVVDKVQLGSVLDQPIETLSKGFKRRVGLAQAIVHDPEILVLDEPTDGLDPNQKHEVRKLIGSMASEKVTILSTHILEEVEAVCTRAIIIADGRIVSDSSPDELVARSRLHNALTCAVHGTVACEEVEALQALPEVDSVETLESTSERVRLQIYPEDNAALLGPVSAFARERGWELEELHVERGRLDEVFREITGAKLN